MKRLISALTLAALLGSAAAANAETGGVASPVLETPGMQYVAILVKNAPITEIALPAPEFKRAFSDVTPLTIQQENEAAERALESQGPPLHTP